MKAEQAARESRLAAEQAKELETQLRRDAEDNAKNKQLLLTASYVEHAQSLCEQGEIGRGMLWFAHSLRIAPQDTSELRQVARSNLAVLGPPPPSAQDTELSIPEKS